MVNPRNRIEERATQYSLDTKSQFYDKLTDAAKSIWMHEIKQAYIAGATDMMENPTGGGLLHVCVKSTARGRRDAIDDAIKVLKEKAKEPMDFENDEICKLLIKEIEKYRDPK